MKTRLILSGLLFLNLISFGQKVNLVIFSEDGDKFYAFVNGIKQNNNAESNVKVTDITPNISLRIEFENKALPNLKQNMALEPGFEHTAKIKRDMKKQLKLRYFGQTPLDNNSTNNVPTVAYHTAEESVSTTNYNTDNTNSNYTTTSTTQTSTITTNPKGTSVNVTIQPIDLNFNGTDLNTGIVTQSSTSTTVTTTSTTNNSQPKDHNHHHPHKPHQTELQTTPATATGCRSAMTPANFDKMKQSVESKPFSDTKMSTAKVATKSNCMSVNQIKEICKLFSMDDDKLIYAKFAYDYCIDKGNYYQVSDVFSFSGTTEDLNKFLETH